GTIEVAMQVNHGALVLGSQSNLTVNGNGTGFVTMFGKVADINAALAGLGYFPAPGYVGSDSLAVSADDLGGAAVGAVLPTALVTTRFMPITVNPITLSLTGTLAAVTAGTLPPITVQAVDGNQRPLTAATINFPVTVTATSTSGKGNTVTGTTTVNAVNGVATFSNLQLNVTDTYTLTFS